MPSYVQKFDVLLKISKLHKSGNTYEAVKLQKVFIESVRNDKQEGRFSEAVQLNRRSKKIVKSADFALTKKSRGRKKLHP